MIIEKIQENESFIRNLYRLGFIGFKLLISAEQYLCFDRYIKLGNKKSDAIQWTADEFRVSCSTIYRVIKKMEQN